MSERRSLVAGVEPTEINPEVARQFIKHGTLSRPASVAAAATEVKHEPDTPSDARHATLGGARRVGVTLRLRPDLAEALKRAALQRELEGVVPYFQKEIVEEVLEPWLRERGYLV